MGLPVARFRGGTKINKSLLQFEERPSTARSRAMRHALCRCSGVIAGDHRRCRDLAARRKNSLLVGIFML